MKAPSLGLHVARQFHPHEDEAADKAHCHGPKSNQLKHHSVDLRCTGIVRLIQHHETSTSQGKHEAAGKPLHDVLAVDPVWHKGYGSCVPVLVCCGANAGRLDNDIVDDAASDEEIGCEDEGEDGPRGGSM